MEKNDRFTQHEGYTLLKQPYAITIAKHRLNVHEMRIMFRVIEVLQSDMRYGKKRSDIQKTLFGDHIIYLRTNSLVTAEGKNYSSVKRALKSLEQKSIEIKGTDEKGKYVTNSRLIMKSKYYLNNQMIEIQLDRDLLCNYLFLAKNYTKYLLEVAFSCSSPYVMKLYQFISHWKDKHKVVINLEHLRDYLQMGTKYAQTKNFRKYILEPASKNLKEKADVWYELGDPIKIGKAITGYTFKIYKHSNNNAEESRKSILMYENLKKIFIAVFKLNLHQIKQIDPILAKSELHSHIHDKIADLAQQVDKNKVMNIPAYVIKSLYNEFGEHFKEKL